MSTWDNIVLLFNNWYFQDAIVTTLVLGLGWMGWQMSRREYWRSAFRQVFARRGSMTCFIILCIYVTIALLDSVGYHPALRDNNGVIQRNKDTGRIIYDQDGTSMLDIILTELREPREKTYSAPLEDKLFQGEISVGNDGKSAFIYPKLKSPGKHVLGTDRVGNDVLFLAIKGVRTGMIIGAFTMLIIIPFAIFFGAVAGYFGGWMDDVIQYIYTVLSSIPSVLLIVAFMIIFDKGLPQLCIIMGITSWTGLCRVLRGETLKLREQEYIQACEAMGVSRFRIIVGHIVPNFMHIVLITTIIGFSDRVMAEAVLSYIGIGVGADTISWGMMINDARMELARDPVIWWKLVAAFIFMVGLILPANLFGDAVRDALDPRLKTQ